MPPALSQCPLEETMRPTDLLIEIAAITALFLFIALVTTAIALVSGA